jgi:uncharacterized protein YndB with AHSA1/START domain
MPSFERRVHIDAAPERVWSVMTDVERWPVWTPSVRRVERLEAEAFGVGSRARLWLNGAAGGSTWVVTAYERPRSFTWRSRVMPGVVSVADHEITPDEGGCSVMLRVTFSGPLAGVAGLVLASVSRRNMEMEAEGLKRESEGA